MASGRTATGTGPSTIAELVDTVSGSVLQPGQAGFDKERTGFQAGFTHHPSVIVAAAEASDMQAAVRYACAHELPVAVQSTGHGLTVALDGGVLVTTGRMNGVTIDPAARRARLEAGVQWDAVIDSCAPYGLAPLSGSAPHVGAVGYTLGGGLGLLGRQFGYAADHVRRMEVVTADGFLRTVTPQLEPDLCWALLGGRDNFGLVASLDIDLVPVSRVYGGGIFFDASLAEQVLAEYQTWTAGAPEELTASLGMVGYPDMAVFPEPLRGRHVVHLRFATTLLEEGPQWAADWRRVGRPILENVREMPYTEAGTIYQDPTFRHAYHGNSALLSELNDEILTTVRRLAGPGSAVPCIVDIRHLGGALSRQPAVPNAIGFRNAGYILRILSPVSDQDLAPVQAAQRAIFDAVAPWTLGRSVSFVYGRAGATDHVESLYEPRTLARLAQLKAVYDPRNIFRSNHNIRPA